MVEFTGVHGTFTVLQVNAAEMTGAGMLTAVMDMSKAGMISADRVRALIKPYHIRQIESDAIDSKSLHALKPFGRGISVLPRAAVTGRMYFDVGRAKQAREAQKAENVILAKDRFSPTDAMDMQYVSGICSLSPAAIHVVTAAQNLGIPALLNLEEVGIKIYESGRLMVNRDGVSIREGDWVSISSRFQTLYIGKAMFAPARLLRFMAGQKVELTPAERVRFEALAAYYREFRTILESVDASEFESLQDLGHAIRYGRFRDDPGRAAEFVNRLFRCQRGGLGRATHGRNAGDAFDQFRRLRSPDRRTEGRSSEAGPGCVRAKRNRRLSGRRVHHRELRPARREPLVLEEVHDGRDRPPHR